MRPTAGQHRTTGQVALSGRQVPTFHARAKTKLAPPPRRTPPGQSTGTRQAHPGTPKHPRFRCQPFLTTRHQWFARARLRDPHLPRSRRDFPLDAHHHGSLTAAARGGLRPPPAQRPRRATRTPTPGSSISRTAPHPATDLLHPASFNVRGTPQDEDRKRRPSPSRVSQSHGSEGALRNGADAATGSRRRLADLEVLP